MGSYFDIRQIAVAGRVLVLVMMGKHYHPLPFGDVVKAVEGEPWQAFADRKGDWGRDLALCAGRMRCGLTLGELGGKAGGMGVQAVAKAVVRMEVRMRGDAGLKRELSRVLKAISASGKA